MMLRAFLDACHLWGDDQWSSNYLVIVRVHGHQDTQYLIYE